VVVPLIISVLQISMADSTLRPLRNVSDVNGYLSNVKKFVIDMG
jgi:hypothetical protein